jgi:hypothetical protein
MHCLLDVGSWCADPAGDWRDSVCVETAGTVDGTD